MPRRRWTNRVEYPRDAETAERIEAVAEGVVGRERLDAEADRWGELAVERPIETIADPVLALDDYSAIPFLRDVIGLPWYQYRARLRCGDGDLFAVARPGIPGYEEYNREYLGLGSASMVRVSPDPDDPLALARRLRSDATAFTELCVAARKRDGMLLHPYMGIRPVWELAEAVREAADVRVRVLAPFPRVTMLANDKARFSAVVKELLGHEALARTCTSEEPSDIAELLRDEIGRCDAVALKLPACASGMGNRVYPAAKLRGKPLRAFKTEVDRFLDEKEWDGKQPVLVVEWHRDILESPSTQCWIPPAGTGEPVVEEVYQQFLVGEPQVFEGAMLSALPRRPRHDFMVQSWLLCRVFQEIGYVGRCSFDGLVVGLTLDDARVKLVECNGRWGGTSTPMHLMKRVFGDFRHAPYKAQDYVDRRLIGLEFTDLMEVFGRDLYDRRTRQGRVLLYNVGGVREYGKFDLVVIGRSFAEVQRYISRRIPALISRYCRKRGRNPAAVARNL